MCLVTTASSPLGRDAPVSGPLLGHLEACLLLVMSHLNALSVDDLDVPEDFVDLFQRFSYKPC